MKKRLIVTVLLLCMAFLMASMAYNQASVTNAAALKVVNTNDALLTLQPNAHWNWGSNWAGTLDKTAVVKDGELFFQFGKGVAGSDGTTPVFYGLQPNSSYAWNALFTLRNKSADMINVTIRCEGAFAQYMTFGTCGQGTILNPTWGTQGAPFEITRIPKETNSGMQNIRNICVKIDLPSGVTVSAAELIGSIIVDAVAINP